MSPDKVFLAISGGPVRKVENNLQLLLLLLLHESLRLPGAIKV